MAGYDNTFGLPPFFPTRLRFEDYIYRLWVQQDGVAAAHVDAAQNHTKSNYMRNPVGGRDLQRGGLQPAQAEDQGHSLRRTDDLTIGFDYDGEVTAEDAKESLDKVAAMYGRALEAAEKATAPERADALRLFAANLQKAFYGFEPDFFQQNLLADRGRRGLGHQGVDRVVADPGRDLLLRERAAAACRRSASRTGRSESGRVPPASRAKRRTA